MRACPHVNCHAGADSAAPERIAQPDSIHDVVAEMLMQRYRGEFRLRKPTDQMSRTAGLDGMNRIRRLGSYFQLAGYISVVDQVLQALWDLEGSFRPGNNLCQRTAAAENNCSSRRGQGEGCSAQC